MEAVQFTLKERKLEHVRKPRPTISSPYDVLIKVCFCGISGKDLLILDGLLPCNSEKPFFLGQELCGIVHEIGEQVSAVKKGDKVVVDPNSGCGICDYCKGGTPHYCKEGCGENALGVFKNGGWAEYVLVPESQVYGIPVCVTLEQAALTYPMVCISHGWDMLSPIILGQKILIVGSGLIGDLWAALLHYQGHRKITVSEPNLARLEYTQKLDAAFDCTTPVILKERQLRNSDYLFDLIIDCSGSEEAITQECTLLSPGGKLCIFGVKPPDSKVSISPFDIYQKEVKIIGVNVSTFNFPKALALLECLGEKYLNFERLGIKTYALSDYRNAVDHVRKRSVVKALFSMTIRCLCPGMK